MTGSDLGMPQAGSWRPTATRRILESRAQQLSWVRGFFAQRGVLEVETPVLGQCGVTDVNIDSAYPSKPSLERRRNDYWVEF